MANPFLTPASKPATEAGLFDNAERGLANRNSGTLLETLALDITPAGAHYLLTHFDTPILEDRTHRLTFKGAFENPFEMSMGDIRACPQETLPVTLECAGNGRAGLSPRRYSMPWLYEAAGTSEWTGSSIRSSSGPRRTKRRTSMIEQTTNGASTRQPPDALTCAYCGDLYQS